MRLACCLFVLTIHAIVRGLALKSLLRPRGTCTSSTCSVHLACAAFDMKCSTSIGYSIDLLTEPRACRLRGGQLCAEVAGKTSKHAKKKKAKAANKHSYSETGGCAGRRGITHADVFGFFDEAASGRRTRAEVVAQADRVLADLELGCTPGLGDDPALYEKLQSLTWGFLHDGPRTLRGIELRTATLSAAKKPVGDRGSISSQLALLGERARILRAYGNRSASHYSDKWPPGSSDGHVAYPSKGCGGFPSSVRPASGRPVVEGDNGALEQHVDQPNVTDSPALFVWT